MDKLQHIIETVNTSNRYSASEIMDAIYSLQEETDRKGMRAYFSMLQAKDEYMKYDALDGKYKRKSEKDYEKQRLAALKKLENMEDVSQQIEFIVKTAKEIDEGIKHIAYNNAFKECCEILYRMEMCRHMAEAGATLTEIVKYVPETEMGDAYHLLEEHLGISMAITDEERKQIEKFDKEHPLKKKKQ